MMEAFHTFRVLALFLFTTLQETNTCPCITSCVGKSNRDYHSCNYGCSYYASCWNGVLTDGRPCPWPTKFDYNFNACRDPSSTCPCPPPTARPTLKPTPRPTLKPTPQPTLKPTLRPSPNPTKRPTLRPSLNPTKRPTLRPSLNPTAGPTLRPSLNPTKTPTIIPSVSPSAPPSLNPTSFPTAAPTKTPTIIPSVHPTKRPTQPPNIIIIAGPTERGGLNREAEAPEFENTDENVNSDGEDPTDDQSSLSMLQIFAIVIASIFVLGLIIGSVHSYWMYYSSGKKAESDARNIVQSTDVVPGMKEPGSGGEATGSEDDEGLDDTIIPNLPEDSDSFYDTAADPKETKGETEGKTKAKRRGKSRKPGGNPRGMGPKDAKSKSKPKHRARAKTDPKPPGSNPRTIGKPKDRRKGKTPKPPPKKKRVSVLKRRELLQLNTAKLAKMCRKQKVAANGSKADMVNRLLDAAKASHGKTAGDDI